MTALHAIGRAHAAYRIPAGAPEARDRLDALLERVLETALDGALVRAGVADGEEVCVARVAAEARVSLAATDEELVARWSASLVDVLAAAIAAGEPGVVRYRSRRQALVDVALGAAAGDLRRAWAWRRLGLWPGEEPGDGAAAAALLVDALCTEPHAVVAVLAAVARRGTLPRLAVLLTAAGWQRLARAALAAAGLTESLLAVPPARPRAPDGYAGSPERARGPEDADNPAAARARDLFARSALATAAAGSGAAVGLSAASRRALALLAALEADPGSLALADEDAAAALVAELAAPLDAPAAGRRPRGRRGATGRRRAVAGTAGAGAEPEADAARATQTATGTAAEPDAAAAADEPDVAAPALSRAWTEHGGLLFLLPLVAELEPCPARTLRWTLHRLALVLLPGPDAADPAALAFAGLAPEEPPPSDDAPPPTEEELAALAAVAVTLAAQVARLLEREPEPALLASVCARRAEVVAEPGRIELHLSLEQLDVDVRRAGLDLDPGWLPWLGVVVRFVYA